ncbi:hypothetical protein QOZ80_5AG0391470 [Eleusine coracana subsp. coracana]|nr:hypothetical protein QOZ80_5AG0391470 [Eleusine coracana subsp. coracana]
MDKLTDDLLIEIFSRVPYKCLRRFACVSRRWRALIAHPDNRRKLPQTLAGFFYYTTSPRFADVSGTDPPFFDLSLAFLPDREREGLDLVDGCNGLLLFRCYRFADAIEFDYLSSTLPQRSGLQCRSHGVGRTRCAQLAWGSIRLSPRISMSLSFNWIGLRIAIVKIMTMMGMGMSWG